MRAVCAGWGFLVAGALWAQPYVISTVAGGATPATPFPGISTGIYEPGGLAADAAGNVYFASLNYVFRLGRDGMLTRVAGTPAAGFSGDGGLAVNAQLSNPYGVAVDGAGNLYIGDTGNNRIRKVAPSGIITTLRARGPTEPPATAGRPRRRGSTWAPAPSWPPTAPAISTLAGMRARASAGYRPPAPSARLRAAA